jgi:hypothetical protein
MVWFSHCPTVMPARRAAIFAASRASGSTPLTLQGDIFAIARKVTDQV